MTDARRQYLKKVGGPKLRLFGWTPTLAAREDMIECDATGKPIPMDRDMEPGCSALSSKKIFEHGMAFQMLSSKTMRAWVEENMNVLNDMPLDIQGVIIAKWQKHYGGEPMPDGCTFMVSGITPDLVGEAADIAQPLEEG